jgi:prepilin-type N-terminal cleavage/methylation domain-containing protein
MRNSEGFTLIELMIVVVILALLATIAIPNFIKLQGRAKEAKAKGAAHTLQLAAEDFAVRNGAIYSDAAADLTPLLPVNTSGTRNLKNPFTGNFTEPKFAAAVSGQVGIVAQQDATGTSVGYLINAWGINDEVLLLSSGN